MNRFNKKQEKNMDVLYQIGFYQTHKNNNIFVYPTRERIDEDDDSINILINTDFALWDIEMTS